MVEVNVKCMFCEEQVAVGTHNIEKRLMATADGSTIWVTYFVCSKCAKKNFVQVDSDNTHRLLEKETKLLVKALKGKKFGKTPHKKQSEKRKQIAMDLANSRKMLMDSLKGQTVIDCKTEESYILCFNK